MPAVTAPPKPPESPISPPQAPPPEKPIESKKVPSIVVSKTPIDKPAMNWATGNSLVLFVLFPSGICIYFVPLLVAISRSHHNVTAIIVVNLLLGWTLVGWGIALGMSFGDVLPSPEKPRR
jgi:hypothetical protein